MEKDLYNLEYLERKLKNKITARDLITDEYCYNFVLMNNFDEEKIKKLSDISNIRKPLIKEMAEMYLHNLSKKEQNEYRKKEEEYNNQHRLERQTRICNNNSSTFNLIAGILKLDDINEAINQLIENKVTLKDFNIYSDMYETKIKNNGDEEEYNNVKKRLTEYSINYLNIIFKENMIKIEQNKKENKEKRNFLVSEKIEIANNYISKFTNGSLITIDEYCKQNNISKEDFEEFVKTVKNRKLPIYKEYKDRITELRLSDNEIKKQVELLKKLMVEGIKENDKIRKFELLDYCTITKIDIGEFLELVINDLTIPELRIIKSFVKSNLNSYHNTHEIDTTNEKIFYLINGKEIEATKEDKDYVVEYMKENEIPTSDIIYKQALRRYMYFKEEEKKEFVKTRCQ